MASSSGISSGSGLLLNSGSEEELRRVMDLRKRKRMESNRESARRSRLRKRKQVDDLTAEAARLTAENQQLAGDIGVAARGLWGVEGENTVLRAQVAELSRRLESTVEIIRVLDSINGCYVSEEAYNAYCY
ncbi:hypothetical protein NMG60_11019552 [Bertholletia excelsa]